MLSITCLAQKKDKRYGSYNAYLSAVEVSNNATVGIVDTLLSSYEDSILKINWIYGGSQLGFDLKNKSGQTLKIIWDDAAFISINNESDKVFHKGIKYTDRENSQPPTSVYKNTNLSDLIAPTSYATYTPGQYGGWRSGPLIPVKGVLFLARIEYDQSVIGKTMRVILPIKIEENTTEYTFSFKIEFLENEKKKKK